MLKYFALLLSILLLLACQDKTGVTSEDKDPGRVDDPVLPGDVEDGMFAATTEFGLDVFGKLATEYDGQNLFVSAPSIAIALAMTYNGASGTTKQAMAQTLGFGDAELEEINATYADLLTMLSNPDSAVALTIANSLWARQGLPFKDDFLKRNETSYRAEVAELDFNDDQSADIINGWVDEQTHHKISTIVDPPINPATILFLINAIYFKGTWTYEFDEDLTEDRAFHLLSGSTKQHPMMYQSEEYMYLETPQFQAVRLPYGNGRLSMYVFLPDVESNLGELQQSLTAANWTKWMGSFRELEGDVALPRFKLEFKTSLNDALTALGMGVAFDPMGADFSAMFPVSAGANVYISDVKHKTFVEVNEQGTEASAVTSVEVGVTSMQPHPKERFSMTVDRPFFFAIRDDRTGVVLFMGSIVEPL